MLFLFVAVAHGEPSSYDPVKAILAKHCLKCHGPDEQESDFRVDLPRDLIRGGDSGEPAVVAGEIGKSYLYERITTTDEDSRMPPEGKPLSKQEIETIEKWIKSGAPHPGQGDLSKLTTDHWSFQPLQYKVPPLSDGWIQNPIDSFTLQKLRSAGLAPSKASNPDSLLRRIRLVLHGLPPTVAELQQFRIAYANDATRAIAELIDNSLASPRLGERWAVHWLDVARFGETTGFETNRERPNAYHFRDYVVRSFNDDKPYDQFVREQIAGDAFGNDVGTGFLVAGPYDIVKSQDINLTLMQRQDELADMINTTGTAFLGLTLGCARCHNHKFDPITQRDYYAIQAIFAGVRHGDRKIPAAPNQQERLIEIAARVKAVKSQLAPFIAPANAKFVLIDDEPTGADSIDGANHLLATDRRGNIPAGGQRGHAQDAGSDVRSPNLGKGKYSWWPNVPGSDLIQYRPRVNGKHRIWISWGTGYPTHTEDAEYWLDKDGDLSTKQDQTQLAIVNQKQFSDSASGLADKPLWSGFLNAGIHELHPASSVVLRCGKTGTAITADAVLITSVTDSVSETSNSPKPKRPHLRSPVNPKHNIDQFASVEAKFVRFTIERTNSGQPCIDELEILSGETNVALASLGSIATSSSSLPGYEIHKLEHVNDGRFGNGRSWISNEVGGWVQIELAKTTKIQRIEWSRDREGRFTDRTAIGYRIEYAVEPGKWKILSSSADRLNAQPSQQTQVAYQFDFVSPAKAAEGRELLAQLQSLRAEQQRLSLTTVVYSGNFAQPGPTHRLYRGEPMAKREEVGPDALEVMGTLGLEMNAPEQQRRKAFANWIADKKNPLTARVIVNRLWQYHFGTGLVATPSDFGANGIEPSHPELLDYLAAELIRRDWSLKHIHRLILTSNTFQQSSAPNAVGLKVDAATQLLWRFPPRRLEAEAIRDSMVLASGAIDMQIGGRGFSAFEVSMENVRHYFPKKSYGPGDWRRMVYMTKVRQEKDATFGVFDCPDNSQVIPRRSRSTTPLQALNLLNSPFVIQQAAMFAARLEANSDKTAEQVSDAYQIAFQRPAQRDEIDSAVSFIDTHGLPAFCRAILNSNEFLFVP